MSTGTTGSGPVEGSPLNGYVGAILRVDLTSRCTSTEPLNTKWAKQYLGCQGLGVRYLYEEVPPGADALGPENRIVLMTGPITGTIAPTGQKYTIITKSPLTKTFYDSTAGGHFGPELKYAGYDGIIIEGQADSPVYLLIRNGRVQIMDAARVWGCDTHTTEDRIKEWWGEVKVLSIGPAGENLVRFACVTTEYYRQNGRGGIGAVFGAKNLKAIAVKGTGAVGVSDPGRFVQVAWTITTEKMAECDDQLNFIGWRGGMGTLSLMDWTNDEGVLPTRNFRQGSFESKERIDQEAYRKVKKSSRACCQCPMACGQFTIVPQGQYAGTAIEGPEFETAALLGSNCGIGDPYAIMKMNLLCDTLGVDTMACGDVIAWAMECFERGILTSEDTGGLQLLFGNHECAIDLVQKIATRDGIGDLLAEGVARAAQQVGQGSADFAMHVKGLEIPGYDPRPAIGMGLAYATAPPGAVHTRGYPISAELFGGWWLGADPVELDPASPANKARLLITQQHWQAYRFSTGTCDFGLFDPPDGLPEEVSSCTGWPESADWKTIGERIVNLCAMFSDRHGVTREEFTLPARLLDEPIGPGASEGKTLPREHLEHMLREYFELRGWASSGRPTPAKLAQLGIDDLPPEANP